MLAPFYYCKELNNLRIIISSVLLCKFQRLSRPSPLNQLVALPMGVGHAPHFGNHYIEYSVRVLENRVHRRTSGSE
jgi:hypothetical protein